MSSEAGINLDARYAYGPRITGVSTLFTPKVERLLEGAKWVAASRRPVTKKAGKTDIEMLKLLMLKVCFW
jgi:hypothetical protein